MHRLALSHPEDVLEEPTRELAVRRRRRQHRGGGLLDVRVQQVPPTPRVGERPPVTPTLRLADEHGPRMVPVTARPRGRLEGAREPREERERVVLRERSPSRAPGAHPELVRPRPGNAREGKAGRERRRRGGSPGDAQARAVGSREVDDRRGLGRVRRERREEGRRGILRGGARVRERGEAELGGAQPSSGVVERPGGGGLLRRFVVAPAVVFPFRPLTGLVP